MLDETSQQLLARYRAGDERAAVEIHDRYVQRLRALAQKRLATKWQRRLDADDVVQSAYRSFFVRARGDHFQLQRSGDLWRLLAQITVHKLLKELERHSAKRRDMALEQEVADFSGSLVSGEPNPAAVAAVIEHLQMILAKLTPLQRKVLQWSLQAKSTDTIAAKLQRSPRTIRRLLATIRQLMEAELLPPPSSPARRRPAAKDSQLSFGDYVLEEHIGTGGMGKVYRGRRKQDGAPVAIKALLKRRQRNEDAVQQFEREANYVSRLVHPHIVPIHGLGQFPAGGYFLVMDYVAGEDLARRLAAGAIPERLALQIARQICSAIQFAHQQGVLHCDLKPSNILVDQRGHALVTDFGMARLLQSPEANLFRVAGGTPAFMAPEQFPGTAAVLGTATDVFGFGGILFAMLTGRPPRHFTGRLSSQRLSSLLHKPIVSPRQLNPDISQEISALCEQCLMTSQQQRIATFDHVGQRLAELT